MTLVEIARSLGIEAYPEALDAVYEAQHFYNPCDHSVPEALQAQYDLFGQYYDALLAAMEQLPEDPARYTWAKVVSAYIQTVPVEISSRIPMPATDGTPAGDLLPLIIMLPLIPLSIKEYRRKGFSEEEIQACLKAYQSSLNILTGQYGRPVVNQLYFWWLGLYAKAAIFRYGSFQFELRKAYNDVTFLKNQLTGQCVPVMTGGTVHHSGRILGSAGCTDPTNAFTVTLRETEDAWYGHAATASTVSPEETCYPKSLWTCILRPGDAVLSMHISRKADLSPKSVAEALSKAGAIAAKSYPEYNLKGIICHSWLLDPALERILGSDSNIAGFGNRFVRYPLRAKGTDVFTYVFPPNSPIDETLPENTRLQRGVKQLYLNGGYIYAHGGLVL